MSESSLPENWVRCMSKKFKQYYYFNTETSEALWVHPLLRGSGASTLEPSVTKTSESIAEKKDESPSLAGLGQKKKKKNNKGKSTNESERFFKIKKGKGIVKVKDKDKNKTDGTVLSAKDLEYLVPLKNREKTCQIAQWANDVVKGRPGVKKDKQLEELKLNGNLHQEGYNIKYTRPPKKVYEKNSNNNIKQIQDVKKKNSKAIVDSLSQEKKIHQHRNNLDSSEVTINKCRYQPYKKGNKNSSHSLTSSSSSQQIKEKGTDETQENPIKSNSVLPPVKKLDTSMKIPKIKPNINPDSKQIEQPKKLNNPFLRREPPPTDISFQRETNLFTEIGTSFQSTDNIFQQQQQVMREDSFSINNNFSSQTLFMTNTNIQNGNVFEISNTSIQTLSQVQPSSHDDEEESMDIDDAPELRREILREIREIREENIVAKPTIPDANTSIEHTQPVYTDPLYIVLDTNVLLGHLKFVQELKDYPIPGVGAPILYIPWIVLQELDSLKDAVKRYHRQVDEKSEQKSYKLSVFARNAIKFVNVCLENDHPRLKGQTVIEAGTSIDGFNEETNDDSIIHAALGLKMRAVHSHIVIFSNDRNLCNKSMVAGIKAFSHQNLMMGLRSLFQSGTVAVQKENFAEYFEEYQIQELIAKRRKQSDELSCELQCILREGLSKIIEQEMIEAYDDSLWLQIVNIQPPWTLHDVFVLLEKHWIAVFGMIVKRNLAGIIGELKQKFRSCEGSPGCLEDAKKLLELSLKIFQEFSTRSSYDDMVTKCITGVQVLFTKCKEFIQQAVPERRLPATQARIEINRGLNVSGHSEQSVESSHSGPLINEHQPRNPHETVMETFDAIWRTVTHFSALIFYSLNFPSPLIKELNPEDQKPEPKEALACLMTMTKCLLDLIRMIQTVIRIPVEKLSNSEQTIVKLLEGIFIFMKEVMKQDCDVKPTELLQFCRDENTRVALIQGLSQLDRSYAMLQQCIEYNQTVT